MEIIKYTKSGIPVVGLDENGNNLYLHNCSICDREFTSIGTNSKYCNECKDVNLFKSIDHNVCFICGKPFIGNNGYQKYCSDCENIQNKDDIHRINNKPNTNEVDINKIKLLIEFKVNKIINQSKEKGLEYNEKLIDYWAVGRFNDNIKSQVRERDNFKCQICGKDTNLHVHHIIPRRKGGSHDLENLILLCSSCHMAIETGDSDHAIRKCTKNALKYGGHQEDSRRITDSYKVVILQECLQNIFEKLSGDSSYKDILIDISSTLGKTED